MCDIKSPQAKILFVLKKNSKLSSVNQPKFRFRLPIPNEMRKLIIQVNLD
jgi:hypothetical protein